MFQPKWQKVRPTVVARSQLEQAVAELNRRFGVEAHLIRHPFGKLLAFQAGDLSLVHAGDGGRPPRFWTVGLVGGPDVHFLFPEQDPSDFAACCDLVGIQDEADREAFRQFLFPQAGRPTARPVPGAV